jgi:hypothetical protein
MFHSNRRLLVISFLLLASIQLHSQSIDLKTLKSLVFAPSINEAEKQLKPFGYSFEKSGKIDRGGTQFDFFMFQRIDIANSSKEAVIMYLDTNVLKRINPSIRYMSFAEKTFDQLKDQCEELGAKILSEENENQCFYRVFKKSDWTYSFSICEQKDGGSIYAIDININWQL